MEKYGGILMQNLPGETVAFLKLLCTDYRKSDDPIGQGDRDKRQFSNPDNYLRHFFKCPQEAIDFLEHIVREVIIFHVRNFKSVFPFIVRPELSIPSVTFQLFFNVKIDAFLYTLRT